MKMKMTESLRGEMLAGSSKLKYPVINLDWILNASKDESNEESTQLRQSLIPWLIATCAQTDDIARLNQIQQAYSSAHFNTALPTGSMPLHVCAKYGAVKCADLLLRYGSNGNSIVNDPDPVGFTALYYAILQQNEPMIELLIQNGAQLTATFKPSEIGMYLCNCVKNNQIDRLRAWHKAGADLDQPDYDGRTPLLLVNQLITVKKNRIIDFVFLRL